jgi:hypothetical protein
MPCRNNKNGSECASRKLPPQMGGHGCRAYGRRHVLSRPVAISVGSTCASPSRVSEGEPKR